MPSQSGPKWRRSWKKFGDLESEGRDWITIATANFFPDYLVAATARYGDAFATFGDLVTKASSSDDLFDKIMAAKSRDRRALLRIFRRYVSPSSPVELIKRTGNAEKTRQHFGDLFRPIDEVRAAFRSRPAKDEALAAILWEHQERGKRGADLTAQFFEWVSDNLADVEISGGRDIPLKDIFPDYPKDRGVDFVMKAQTEILAVGFLHYDSDRGGSQEADRTGQYGEAAEEIVPYLQRKGLATKLIFVNDGPGLLAGKMWKKYAALEERWPFKILVTTLKMLPARLTTDWLTS